MAKVEKFYAKLSPECQADMEALIFELKDLNNEAHKGKRCIGRNEIVPLPDDKYTRLWGYLRHCCHLVACWPNKRRAIETIASKRHMDIDEVREEAVDSMTIHCYTYVWRHYEHSDEPTAYILATAKYGWLAWIDEQNNFHCGIDDALAEYAFEANRCGHRNVNVNFA